MAKDGEPVVRLPSPGSHDKPAEAKAKAEDATVKTEPVEEPKPAKKATASKQRQ